MEVFEIILLGLTYTTLVLSIFVSVMCYLRDIEKWETIAFTSSLLTLILSMTFTSIAPERTSIESIHISILLSTVLVGLTTPINVMSERQHKIPISFQRTLYLLSGILFIATYIAHLIDKLFYMEYIVMIFLGGSIISSMVFTKMTKPQKSIYHLEKMNQIFGLLFLVLVPASLITNYTITNSGFTSKIGLTIPLMFILLSGHKLLDDLKRLSLIKTNVTPQIQHFENHHLTKREQEIASLLIQGKTYAQISEALFISLPTVKTHTSNIYKKFKISSKHELMLKVLHQ